MNNTPTRPTTVRAPISVLIALLVLLLAAAIGLILYGPNRVEVIVASYLLFALSAATVTFGFLGATGTVKTRSYQLGGSAAIFVAVFGILLRTIPPDNRTDVSGIIYMDGLPVETAVVTLLEVDSADTIRPDEPHHQGQFRFNAVRGVGNEVKLRIKLPKCRDFVATQSLSTYIRIPLKKVDLPCEADTVSAAERCPDNPKSVPVDLIPYANQPLNWLLSPPIGQVVLDGVSFQLLAGDRAVVTTRHVGDPFLPREVSIRFAPVRGCRAHVLVSGAWTDRSAVIGSLAFQYVDGTSRIVELIPGSTIRETWLPEKTIFAAPTPRQFAGVNWRAVWKERQQRGDQVAIGLLDLLSVDLDITKELHGLRIQPAGAESSVVIAGITLSVG